MKDTIFILWHWFTMNWFEICNYIKYVGGRK